MASLDKDDVIDALSEASDRTFTPRVVRWAVAIGIVSLLATLLLSVLTSGGEPTEETADTNAYSYSAVGHRAFAELLERVDIDVTVSRHRSAQKASARRPLLLLEPARGSGFDERDYARTKDVLVAAIRNDVPVVVAVPKWWVAEETEDERWANRIESVDSYDRNEALTTVAAALIEAGKLDYVGSLTVDTFDAATGRAQVVGGASRSAAVSLSPAQVLTAQGELEPLITLDGDDNQILFARLRGTTIYLLSDPDIINTMGIGTAEHAQLALTIVADLLAADGVVIDEVSHGFEKVETIWQELFQFPLVLLTLHLAGLLALALWTALVRFGKPEARPPRVPSGKQTLLDNTATLLALGRHAGHGAKRYFETTLRALARSYGIAPEASEDARIAQLAAIAKRRGSKTDLATLAREVEALADRGGSREQHRAQEIARRIFAFREELTDGHRIDS